MIRYAAALFFAFQPQTFHTSTQLVEVSVVVRDKIGPAANLSKNDFTVTDRGKPRMISFFSQTVARPPEAAAPLPPNTFSNRPQASDRSTGSVTIVLLDALNTLYFGTDFASETGPTRFENQALAFGKNQLMKFVQDLDPKDRVAIYALGKSLRVLCDYSNDAAHLRQVLDQYRESSVTLAEISEPPPAATPNAEFNAAIDVSNQKIAALANGDRASQTISALLAIANHAAGIPGRKNLVWLTASLPFRGEAIARVLSRSGIAIYPVDARGLIASFNPRYIPKGIDTMQELADQSGGRAFYNNNDISTAIRTAVDDADLSYRLGFYVEESALDGEFHDLKIHVRRPGVDIRYPSGYFAIKTDSTAQQRQREIQSALGSPLESSAIHLLARVNRDAQDFSISGSIDIRDLQLDAADKTRKGSVEFFIIQQDALGRVLDRYRHRLDLSLTSAEYDAYLKSGIFFRQNVPAKSGAATIRILAGDPSSARIGSLIIAVSGVH